MRILFLHKSFPGQFRHLLKPLHSEGHTIVFASQEISSPIPDFVEHVPVDLPRIRVPSYCDELLVASCFYKAFRSSSITNVDIIVSHAGWGCGLAAFDLFPRAKKIAYHEWYFSAHSLGHIFSSGANDAIAEHHAFHTCLRNAALSYELSLADAIVAPTSWQLSSLPRNMLSKASVIYDALNIHALQDVAQSGFDDDYSNITHRLTYASRGMETVRMFPEFIRASKECIAKNCFTLSVIGSDRVCYGGPNGIAGMTFGSWAKDYLSEFITKGQVVFYGQLRYVDYLQKIAKSDLYIYTTRPFVLSWSLIESLYVSRRVIVTDCLLVDEYAHGAGVTRLPQEFTADDLCAAVEHSASIHPRQLKDHQAYTRNLINYRNRPSSVIKRYLDLL